MRARIRCTSAGSVSAFKRFAAKGVCCASGTCDLGNQNVAATTCARRAAKKPRRARPKCCLASCKTLGSVRRNGMRRVASPPRLPSCRPSSPARACRAAQVRSKCPRPSARRLPRQKHPKSTPKHHCGPSDIRSDSLDATAAPATARRRGLRRPIKHATRPTPKHHGRPHPNKDTNTAPPVQ